MQLKISKNEVGLEITPCVGEYVSVSGVLLKFEKATKTHLIFTNVSTTDIDILVYKRVNGLMVKNRYVKGFVSVENPEWRD